MRAILLENDDDIAAILPIVCTRAGITLTIVHNKDALFIELANLHPGDFILIDCSREYPQVINIINRIAFKQDVDIYIIAPQMDDIAQIEMQVGHHLFWLPANLDLYPWLMELRQRLIAQIRAPAKQGAAHLLSTRERQIALSIAQGLTNKQIATLARVSLMRSLPRPGIPQCLASCVPTTPC